MPDVAALVVSPRRITLATTADSRVTPPFKATDAPGPFWQDVTAARAVAGNVKSAFSGASDPPQAPSWTSFVKGRPLASTSCSETDGCPLTLLCAGWLGIVMLAPAGMTLASPWASTVAPCVPFSLL